MIHGDGTVIDLTPADAIFINAGANYPLASWMDGLKLGGRLIFPLTTMTPMRLKILWPYTNLRSRAEIVFFFAGGGVMLRVTRETSGFSVRAITSVSIFPRINTIRRESDKLAAEALRRGDYESIRSVRRDAHEARPSCWLHHDGACLSSKRFGFAICRVIQFSVLVHRHLALTVDAANQYRRGFIAIVARFEAQPDIIAVKESARAAARRSFILRLSCGRM